MRVEGLPVTLAQPALTADELEIVFTLQVNEQYSLWHARPGASTEPFGMAVLHPVNDPSVDNLSAFFSADGKELYFAQAAVSPNYELYRVRLEADGGVGAPELLDTLNSTTMDSEPVLSPDGLSIYFYSTRSSSTTGDGSIWVAHRDTPNGPFRSPVRLEELVVDDGYTAPGSVSADGCRLYFYSNKDRATTGSDLFVAERSPR